MESKNTPLSQRLMSVCSFVPKGSKLADIGTDHARVPIYLIKSGIISRAIASDIGEGPLEKARENIGFFGLSDFVELRLGNGMTTLKGGDADCIVIAGMGGELMANLLTDYIPRGVKRLILQPMLDPHLVRKALCKVGFCIVAEDIVAENDKMYAVIVAEPGEMSLSEEDAYVSPFAKTHPMYEEYLAFRLKRMEVAAENAIKAGAKTHLVEEYTILKNAFADGSIKSHLEAFKAADVSDVGIYKYAVNPKTNNLLVEFAKMSDVIEVIDKKAAVQVADTRRFIDLGELRGIASKVEKLLGQFEGSGETLDVFIDSVRKAKRSAIRTNIGSCIGALGILAPAIMLLSRKLSPESEYQVKKDVEAKLAKEQGLDISKIKV